MTTAAAAPRRRPLLFLGIGVVLAALLAAVLFGAHRSTSGDTVDAAAGPMAGLSAADTSLLQLQRAAPGADVPAPPFTLTDYTGAPTSLAQFRGKVVVWQLNDDRCTDLCTLLANDIVTANRDLGPAAAHVEWLSVNANPYYTAPSDVAAWTRTNDLDTLPNWAFATGTPAQLQAVWSAYHVQVNRDDSSRTVTHSTTLEFIDPAGHVGAIGDFSQGAVSTAFFAHALAQVADDLLPAGQRSKVGGPDVSAGATAPATLDAEAPAFDLAPLAGGPSVSSASLRGTPTVVSFWSSTCSACVQEMPALQAVDDDFAGAIRFVGIDVADPRAGASAFAARLGVHYELLADPDGTAAAAYRVTDLPVTFVVAPDGTVLARHPGGLTHDQLEAVLEMDFPSVPVPSR